jgi:SPP1 family predicted phage head-tail adaptor
MVAYGRKRHYVTLDKPGTPVPDGEGGFTQAREPLSPPDWYVEIKPATARDLERVVANTVQSTASHLVTGDYRPDVNTQTRVTFGARIFEVTGVQNPEERNRDLVLVCEEVVA